MAKQIVAVRAWWVESESRWFVAGVDRDGNAAEEPVTSMSENDAADVAERRARQHGVHVENQNPDQGRFFF